MHRRAEALRGRGRGQAGYTIVELAIVLSIVGILAAVGGSQYSSYLDRARTARAIAELQAIAKQLEPLPDEDWSYPASLADAGIAMRDPWGNPYHYLLISGNLPRGLSDATARLPHVAAPGGSKGVAAPAGSSATTSTGNGAATSPAGGSTPSAGSPTGTGNGASSSNGVGSPNGNGGGNAGGMGGNTGGNAGGGAGQGRAGGGGGGSIMGEVRKDRFQVPINSDFDLYSSGPDGQSRGPLSAKVSHDDVLRANDGAYYGVAEDF